MSPFSLKVWQKKQFRPALARCVLHCHAVLCEWLLNLSDPFKGPIYSRGWALQEVFLSSRELYYGAIYF